MNESPPAVDPLSACRLAVAHQARALCKRGVILSFEADPGLPRALRTPVPVAPLVVRMLRAGPSDSRLSLAVRRRPKHESLHRVALSLGGLGGDLEAVAADLADVGAEIIDGRVWVVVSGELAGKPSHGWPAVGPVPGTRVLMVEDDPVARTVMTRFLERAGCVVSAVGDGPQALTRLQREPEAEVLLLDMGLPGLDGPEIARRIRAGGNCIPIVAVTANPFAADHAECLAAGMNAAITKPVAADTLVAEVSMWTARGGPLPELVALD